jgi:hypothetical protein
MVLYEKPCHLHSSVSAVNCTMYVYIFLKHILTITTDLKQVFFQILNSVWIFMVSQSSSKPESSQGCSYMLSSYVALQVKCHCCASVLLASPLVNTTLTFAQSLIIPPLTSHFGTWWLIPGSLISSPHSPRSCESRRFDLKCPKRKWTLPNVLRDRENFQEPHESQQ